MLLCVGFNGKSDGSFIWCRNQGNLNVANRRPLWGKMSELPRTEVPQMDRRYQMVVRTDAEKTYAEYAGKQVTELPHGPRTSGFLFFWVHSSAEARVGELVVEGRLDPSGIASAKEDWMLTQLQELGWND